MQSSISLMERKKIVKVNSCIFCGKSEDNELLYGKFHRKCSLSVHHNCLFFSSGLVQKSYKNGIHGFLIKDIQNEAIRGQKLKCFYCKKKGATIGCILRTCKRAFHFPCAAQYGCLNQYFGSFHSYCDLHKPQQNTIQFHEEFYCYICCDSIHPHELSNCLCSPCCKNSWFHRLCIQQYALSAGKHFFKCPLCNNKQEFVKEMLDFGVNIPNKDAEWELEDNAFQDLYTRPSCDSEICKCQKGQDHDGIGNWKLFSCSVCGARATHRFCRGLNEAKSWVCDDCEAMQANINSRQANAESCLDSSTLTFTCNPSVIQEILRRRPVVKLLLDKSLMV